MANPVVLAAVRTPIGALHGTLAGRHPVELLAAVLDAAVTRAGVTPGAVTEVVVGCVEQVGGMAGNVARAAVLAAGWPASVGGTTVERGPTSGLAALALARSLVASGATPVAVAAAVDLPSVVPPGAAAMGRHPFGRPWQGVADHQPLVPPGVAAERVAASRGLSRQAQDAWAAASIQRAGAARADGTVAAQIVPVGDRTADEVLAGRPHDADHLAALPPRFDPDGSITAGNSAPPADGAVAVVVADRAWAASRGLAPRVELGAVALTAAAPDDPVSPTVEAARIASAAGGTTAAGTAWVEVSEPTAATALALVEVLALDPARVNPHGGAIALGDLAAGSGLAATVSAWHNLASGGPGDALVVSGGTGVGAAAVLRLVP